MKRIISFTILIFCFLINTASAQSVGSKVLVQSDQPLTRRMIDKSRYVFEFVFGDALTENERQICRNEIVKQ